MLGKKINVNKYIKKDNLNERYCSVCKTIINDDICSSSAKNLCTLCAGETCLVNEKHPVLEKNNKYFCTTCNEFIISSKSYQRWMEYNSPKVNVNIMGT